MLRHCVTLAVLGCVLAVPAPRAQHQYQPQQQAAGVPPHLLRQYLGDQHQAAPAPEHTQAIPRAAHIAAAPRPASQPLYTVPSEAQYQPQQFHAQPQPQSQAQPQYQAQPQPHYQSQAQPQYQAQAQPQYRQQYQTQKPQEQREPEDYDPSPSYQFGFDVNDDQYTNYQNRKEQRDGDTIKGSYSVVDSDGFIRTVTYTADPKEGFRAEVSRMPTDIVVKVPTPKPQPQVAHPQVAHPQALLSQAAHSLPAHPQQRPQPAPQQYYRYEQ